MPLFGRRFFSPPINDNVDEQKLREIYALKRWTCQCSWRASLTYQQAEQSENDIRQTLPTLVAEYFYQPIFDVIYHSVKPLEKLAEEVSMALSQRFVLNEFVQFRKKKDSVSIKGIIESIHDPTEPSSSPMKTVKYTVRLLDNDRRVENVFPSELQRCQMIPNREKLKTFIRSYAIRLGNRTDSPWIFYDHSIVNKYDLKERFSAAVIEKFRKSMTITVDEIVREQERIARKQREEIVTISSNGHKNDDDEVQIILSDDEDLPKRSGPTTAEMVIAASLLNKLDRIHRERGIDSKGFQRVILQCARTLNVNQRQVFPDQYRSLIEQKIEQIELKRRLTQMTDDEKREFFQIKRQEEKPIEDLDLSTSKDLPLPKALRSSLNIGNDSIGQLLMISTFLSSCRSLFSLSLNDDLPKTSQQYFRSIQIETILNCSTKQFSGYFLEILQLMMKLLFKEEENRTKDEEEEDEENIPLINDKNNNSEHIYPMKLTDIPLNAQTCQELTRLFLLKDKDRENHSIVEKLARCETKDFTVDEQIDLLVHLVNTITTDNELMSDYYDQLHRIFTEIFHERQQILAEHRLYLEENNQEKKKLQLNNSIDDSMEIDDDDDDDLKTVLQRRRQQLAIAKEIKEKRELQAQKQQALQRRQLAVQKVEQSYQEALLNMKLANRIKPLGFDRNYHRYWLFPGHPGIFVEKGWIGPDVHYTSPNLCNDQLTITTEKLIPKDEANQWFIYDTEQSIEELIQSLNDRGIREHHLLNNLKKSMKLIEQEFEQMKKWKFSMDFDDESTNVISSFRSELEEIESRLRLGSLGGLTNVDRWRKRLENAEDREDLAELLIELEESVPEKYTSTLSNLRSTWIKDCRTSRTYSRLFVLMMIFENGIEWTKSTEGMKCKICRKKHTDESILVCDQCCYGFHLECFPSSLRVNPKSSSDLWYCPSCRPAPSTKRRGVKRPSTDDDEERLCCVCSMDEDLFRCDQCRRFYHCQCHQPTLRCAPRTNTWICNDCRYGNKSLRKKQRQDSAEPEETQQQRRSKRFIRQSHSSESQSSSSD